MRKRLILDGPDFLANARTALRFDREFPDGHVGARNSVVIEREDKSLVAVWRAPGGSIVVRALKPKRGEIADIPGASDA